MPGRPCGRLSPATRCPAHTAELKRIRNAERATNAAIVAAWVAERGWVCPGYRRPAHASQDLTADHVLPVAKGGAGGPRTVLCRSCNSSKGAR